MSLIQAGQKVTADALNAFSAISIVKPGNTSIKSSTTITSDPDLTLEVDANTTYLFEASIGFEGGTTGSSDIKWKFAVPASALLRYNAMYRNTGSAIDADWYTDSNVVSSGSNGAGNGRPIIMMGTLVVGAAGGSITFQWAQNTSSTTNTIVYAQSYMALLKVT